MRTSNMVLKLIGFLICVGLPLSHSYAQSSYFGEVCIRAEAESESEPLLMRLGVSEIGDGHFQFNGVEIDPVDADPNLEVFDGSGEIIQDQIRISLNSTFDDEEERSDTSFHITLFLGNLQGTITAISTIYEKQTEEFRTGYISGTVSLVSCP